MLLFLDTDSVISSVISTAGAAHLVLQAPRLNRLISPASLIEIEAVANRLHLNPKRLEHVLKHLSIGPPLQAMADYAKYVTDSRNAHIVAAAHQYRCQFLITYNLKHFHQDLIKSKLGVIVLTPGQLLQYLRSLK